MVPGNTKKWVRSETGKESCVIKTATTTGNWSLMPPGKFWKPVLKNTSQLLPPRREGVGVFIHQHCQLVVEGCLPRSFWSFWSTVPMANLSPEAKEISQAKKCRCCWLWMSVSFTQVIRAWPWSDRYRCHRAPHFTYQRELCMFLSMALTQEIPYYPSSCFKVKKILEENVNATLFCQE